MYLEVKHIPRVSLYCMLDSHFVEVFELEFRSRCSVHCICEYNAYIGSFVTDLSFCSSSSCRVKNLYSLPVPLVVSIHCKHSCLGTLGVEDRNSSRRLDQCHCGHLAS